MPLLDLYNIGFALEGNGDYPVLPVLTRRLVSAEFPELPLRCETVIRPRKTGHGFISELPTFAATLRSSGCDALVAVVDSDAPKAVERMNRLREAKIKCEERGIALCIAEGVAVRTIEAWLLSDDAALHQIFGGERARWILPQPESLPEPKVTLNTLVRQQSGGREVSFASYAGDIALQMDVAHLRRRCPSFDRLASNILNCVRQWMLSQN